MTTDQRAAFCGPAAPAGARVLQNPLNGAHSLSSDVLGQVRAEPTTPDVGHQGGYVAHAPSECLNGCQQGSSDQRGPVLCQGAANLCPDCLSRLDKWLRSIPDSYALLDEVRDHGTVPSDPGTKHTKRPDAPAPMRLEVDDLLDSRRGYQYDDDGTPILSDNRRGVIGVVHAWAQLVRDQRQQPARCTCGHLALGHTHYGIVRCTAKKCHCHGYVAIPPTVTAECELLITNLPWCVEQPFAGDLYDEIRTLHRTLTDTLGDYRARPVGSCAVLGERPGVPLPVLCGGALVMDREGHGVRCIRCGTTVRADEGLRELGLIVGSLIREDGPRLEESA